MFMLCLFLAVLFIELTKSHECDFIECSNIVNYICGHERIHNGTKLVFKYLNICYLRRKQCYIGKTGAIYIIPHIFCGMSSKDARRSGNNQIPEELIFDSRLVAKSNKAFEDKLSLWDFGMFFKGKVTAPMVTEAVTQNMSHGPTAPTASQSFNSSTSKNISTTSSSNISST